MEIIDFINIRDLKEKISESGLEQFIVVNLSDREYYLDDNYFQRMEEIASDADATITYCHYREKDGDTITLHPVNDYQFGSVRDDFDFGPLVLLNAADAMAAADELGDYESENLDGGWYALRLMMSRERAIAAVPEFLYTVDKKDKRKSGEKQHDYVNPANRLYQAQCERVFTDYLLEIGALLPPHEDQINFDEELFPVEASVIIPVKNRVKTVGEAIQSALSQETDFTFNVIVVDNDSTDGTSRLLEGLSEDPRLVVIKAKESENLGIGGCWNRAIMSEHCGKFAVQLDSDDLYSNTRTLQRIVSEFYAQKSAMIVGSYMMVDFNLVPIPPGIIAHKEWSELNGHNNCLRINGFGAPRAFYTPVVRGILFPNTSYGEDYAVALRISRDYRIGRIYDPIYLCRRWSGNSDADLSIEKTNEHNEYKDFIRSVELIARVRSNSSENNEIK